MAHFKARDLVRRMTEESLKSGRPIRCAEDVCNTATMTKLREDGLALDADNRRIEGRTPAVRFEDFSLREIAAEGIRTKSDGRGVGEAFIEAYFRDNDGLRRLRESGAIDAVDFSMFYGITGQLQINSILSGFNDEAFVFSKIAGTYPTRMLTGERIPGVSPPKDPDGDGKEDVTLWKEGMPFKYVGFGEEYIDLPETHGHALGIAITRLAIYGDKVGQVAKQGGEVGRLLGLRKEKRGLLRLIGAETYAYKEKRLNDTAEVTIDPYQYANGSSATQLAGSTLSSRLYPFVNDFASSPLTDADSLVSADQAFSKVPNPNTGEPIEIGAPRIFACYTRRFDLFKILKAYEMWKISQAGLTTVGAVNTIGPNWATGVLGTVETSVSRQLRAQLIAAGVSDVNSDKVWWYGDVAQAIQYAENWPIRVIQAPANSEAEFNQDIVARWRADERGEWVWMNPRLLQRHNYLSTT